MRKKIVLITFLLTHSAYSWVSAGDIAMVQTATNTLNSLRELNDILTAQREFSENFERIYSQVDQGIWKADRAVMWMEDVKSLQGVDIEDIDDFNYVLRSLKERSYFLRQKLVKMHNEKRENKAQGEGFDKDKKRIQKRIVKYRSETKSSMSPNVAQVETAKNTKDLLIENAKLNASIKDLNKQMSTLLKYRQNQEEQSIALKLANKGKMRSQSRGALTKREVHK
jgi:hypothetical protein